LQESQIVNVEITGINHRGEGVGRAEGVVIFVPGAVPGERVTVRVEEWRKNHAYGAILEIAGNTDQRQTPACPVSARCGGCTLQHIAYAEQLRLKTELVRQDMTRIGGAAGVPVRDIIGMADPWHYRNNVRFKVRRRAGEVELGFFARGSHRLVADEGSDGPNLCLLAHRDLNRVAAQVRDILTGCPAATPLPAEIMLRRGSTGEIMVVLIGDKGQAQGFITPAEKMAGIPGVVSVACHMRAGGKRPGGRFSTLAGRDYVVDELDGLKFKISAPSFYQVNPAQTAVLYRQALEYCALRGGEEVADAYCGVGTVALYVARYAGAVRGYEVVPGAVRDAGTNAALNGLVNTRFYAGVVERVLPAHVAKGYRPDVVVLDPPRSGCRPEVLDALAASGAGRVVYISCNPATLARDVKRLTCLGYSLQEVQPVDMFPHTMHVEAIILLQRQKP